MPRHPRPPSGNFHAHPSIGSADHLLPPHFPFAPLRIRWSTTPKAFPRGPRQGAFWSPEGRSLTPPPATLGEAEDMLHSCYAQFSLAPHLDPGPKPGTLILTGIGVDMMRGDIR